jgi:hypothetical protein
MNSKFEFNDAFRAYDVEVCRTVINSFVATTLSFLF